MAAPEQYSFITLGPTGSGKGNWRDHLRNFFPSQNLDLTVDILIDEIVEKHPCYRQEVFEYFKDKVKLYNEMSMSDLFTDPILNNIVLKDVEQITDLDNIITDLNKIYFKVRSQIECDIPAQDPTNSERLTETDMCKSSLDITKSCDAKNDKKLIQALENGKSVVIEMVGNKDFLWIFTDPKYSRYTTKRKWIVFMPIAYIDDLIERNKIRAQKVLKSYIIKTDEGPWAIDRKKNPPRLPNVNKETYLSICNAIFEQLTTENLQKYRRILEGNTGSIDFVGFYNANTQEGSKYYRNHTPCLVSIDHLQSIFSNQTFNYSCLPEIKLLRGGSIKKKKLNKKTTKYKRKTKRKKITKRKKTTKPKRKIKRKKTTKPKRKIKEK